MKASAPSGAIATSWGPKRRYRKIWPWTGNERPVAGWLADDSSVCNPLSYGRDGAGGSGLRILPKAHGRRDLQTLPGSAQGFQGRLGCACHVRGRLGSAFAVCRHRDFARSHPEGLKIEGFVLGGAGMRCPDTDRPLCLSVPTGPQWLLIGSQMLARSMSARNGRSAASALGSATPSCIGGGAAPMGAFPEECAGGCAAALTVRLQISSAARAVGLGVGSPILCRVLRSVWAKGSLWPGMASVVSCSYDQLPSACLVTVMV